MTDFKVFVGALAASLLIGVTAAQAHAQLDHASPAVGSTVGSSPSSGHTNVH